MTANYSKQHGGRNLHRLILLISEQSYRRMQVERQQLASRERIECPTILSGRQEVHDLRVAKDTSCCNLFAKALQMIDL